MLRVLLVITDPLDGNLSPVAALEEWQAIARAMAHQQASVTFHRLLPPTWRHLCQILLGSVGAFDVVHLIGHGNATEVVLEDELGCIDWVSTTDLAKALAQRGVRLVVLNVCESESLATELARAGIPAVVATTQSISNQQAIILAQELYGALAAGQPLAEAMTQAQTALHRSEGREAAAIPVVVGDDGLRFEFPRTDTGLPRFQTLNLPKNNLRQTAAFYGRREELQRGLQALAATDVRIVQITGLGGIGKTSLALQMVHRTAWRFFGGVVWLDASAAGGSFHAHLTRNARAVLSSVRFTGEPTSDVEAILAEMSQCPVLLVFDNPDRLPDEVRRDLFLFLKRLPLHSGSKAMLITRTNISQLDDVDGMAMIALRGLGRKSALRFLRQRAALQQVTELASASDTTLQAIADRLGCHPKMMELAVGLVRTLGLADSRRAFSQLPDPFAKKLENLLTESVAMLTAADTEVLRIATTFVGPFTKEWLVGVGYAQVEDSLPTLMDSNLVDRDQTTGYYELHPVVQDYIANTTPCNSEHLQAHDHFLSQRVSELALILDSEGVLAVRPEFDYIVDEVRKAVQRMRIQDDNAPRVAVKGLVAGVRDYLHFHCRDWAAIQALEEAAAEACLALGDRAGLGASLTSLGAALAAQGKVDEGMAKCSEGIDHLIAAGDIRSQSIGYGALGFVNRLQGKMTFAQEKYEQGLALARKAGDVLLEIRHLSNLGTLLRRAEDWEAAEQLYQQALDLVLKTCDQLSLAILLDNLGTNARGRGDLDASLQYHQQAYQLKKATGDEIGLRMSRNSLAATLKRLGRSAEAIPLLEETLWDLDEDVGVLEWWQVLLQLGRMHRDAHEWGTARGYYELALDVAETARYPKGVSMCERGLGLCYEAEGHLRLARERVARAVGISTHLSDPYLPNLLEDLRRIEDGLRFAGMQVE